MPLPRVVATVVVTWLLGVGCLAAELTISPVFSSGMVLQRDAPIVLTGRAAAGAIVEVGLGQHTRSVEANQAGAWRAELDPLPAGGPHVVVVTAGDRQARLDDVLIGDVWLFSGQSNMQMGLDETEGSAAELASLSEGAASEDLPIRLMVVPKAGADSPQSEFPAKWRRCSHDAAARFSAVGWYFAKRLREDEQLAPIPLGLIDVSYGGTAIEAWLPADAVAAIPQGQRTESGFGVSSSGLYNQMIAPLFNYRIKGVAWYQGESNAGNPAPYAGLLETLMAQWRAGWATPRLPFYVVQLPAFDGRIGDLDFSWLREAEARACQNTDDAWLAVTYDTTPGFDLHPREKEEVGRRLAHLALRTQYGRDLAAESPVYERVDSGDDRLSVVFDHPLLPQGEKALRGFEVAGADGEFRYVRATAEGNRAVLDVEKAGGPLAIRYAWGSLPVGNVVNAAGLPAVPFRTDSLAPRSIEFVRMPPAYRVEAPGYALEFGRGGRVDSLTVRGRQFLSRDGCYVPSFFGPRNLAITEVIGPQRVRVRDGEVGLCVAAADREMTWTITNRGGGDTGFRIALDAAVRVESADGAATLSNDGSVVNVSGPLRVEDPHALMVDVPGRGEATLQWTLPTE